MKSFFKCLLFIGLFTLGLTGKVLAQAPPFVAGSANTTACNSTSNCTITLNTHNDGNLIIFGGTSNSMNGSSLPSGGSSPLTCPINNPRNSNSGTGQFMCWKIWHTGDPTSYQFVSVSGGPSWAIGVALYSGEDTSTPVHEVNEFRYSAESGMNPSGGTLIAPGVSPSFLTETRIAIVRGDAGSPTTPSGMTQRAQVLNGGLAVALSIYDKSLTNTTPDPDLSAGNPDGRTSNHTEVTSFLIKPASATSGTRNPVPYLYCYGDVNHINDTSDLANCLVQDGDFVQTCLNGQGLPMQGAYPPVPPPAFNNQISRGFTTGTQAASGTEAHCTYGYWHTGNPTTFAWVKQPAANNPGGIQWWIHRVNSGTVYLGQATTSTTAQSSTSIVSNALTTTQQYAKWLEYLPIDSSATFTPPAGAVSFVQGNTGSYQNAVETDLTSTGSTGTHTFGLSGSNDGAVIGWILAAAPSFTVPVINASGTTCTNAVGTSTITCPPPSGTAGDLLIAPVFELADPTQAVLNAAKPAGWNLASYINDNDLGAIGVTVPDPSMVGLGYLQQLVQTNGAISPSGSTAYTIHGCFQTPQMWGGAGGIIGVDGAPNGTNDTLDRALRVMPAGTVSFAHGATSTLLSGATVLTSSLRYNDGVRHCAAGTFDGTNLRLYMDGALVVGPTSASNSVTLPTTGYWVMDYTKDPGNFYGGPFIEGQMAVWEGTALTLANIQSIDLHMFDGTFDASMAALSPTHWWKLKEITPINGVPDSGGGTNDPGEYLQFRGILNQVAVGNMGDKSPWFPGSFLNGNGGSPQVQFSPISENQTNFSWEAFVQIPTGALGSIIGLDPSPAGTNLNGQFSVYVTTSGKLGFGFLSTNGGGADGVATSASVNDGALHLIDTTWNGTTLKACIDNTCATSNPGTSGRAASSLYPVIGLGGTYPNMPNTPTQNSGSGTFNAGAVPGVIGRVSLWNGVTLTPTQITNHNAHKNDGTYDSVILADNPTSFWKLNETNGATTAIDYGSAGNNGTYTNFQTLAWALWTKTRAASESSVNFPLGVNALAVGRMVDVTNATPTVDGTVQFAMSGLNSNLFELGQQITPANDLQIALLGTSTPGTAMISAYPNPTALLSFINFGTYGATGPTVPDNAMLFDGAANFIYTATNQSNPMSSGTLSQVIAFKTTSTKGGTLINIDSNQGNTTGGSWVPDIWMDNAGHVYCSFYSGQSTGVTLGPSAVANDGNPHIAACTSPAGTGTFTEYLDGVSVGSTSVTGSTGFSGYFKFGGDANPIAGSGYASNVSNPATSSSFLKGTLGEAAIWKGTILTGAQIASLTTHISDGTFDSTLSALTPTYWWKMADAVSTQPTVVESVAGTNVGTYSGNGISGQIDMAPYQSSMVDDGAYAFGSSGWNLGADILLEEGLPPPISGGQVLIFIGQ